MRRERKMAHAGGKRVAGIFRHDRANVASIVDVGTCEAKCAEGGTETELETLQKFKEQTELETLLKLKEEEARSSARIARETESLEARKTKVRTKMAVVRRAELPSVKIECFDGTRNGPDGTEWIQRIEEYAAACKWTDGYALTVAMAYVKGAALSWLRYERSKIVTFRDFCKAFRAAFVKTVSYTERVMALRERVQLREESTVSYLYSKLALTDGLRLEFEEVRELVILGVRSPELRAALIAQKHRDEDELLAAIHKTERLTQAVLRLHGELAVKSTSDNTASRRKTAVSTTKVQGAKEKRAVERLQRRTICYECGREGHVRRDCPVAAPTMMCVHDFVVIRGNEETEFEVQVEVDDDEVRPWDGSDSEGQLGVADGNGGQPGVGDDSETMVFEVVESDSEEVESEQETEVTEDDRADDKAAKDVETGAFDVEAIDSGIEENETDGRASDGDEVEQFSSGTDGRMVQKARRSPRRWWPRRRRPGGGRREVSNQEAGPRDNTARWTTDDASVGAYNRGRLYGRMAGC